MFFPFTSTADNNIGPFGLQLDKKIGFPEQSEPKVEIESGGHSKHKPTILAPFGAGSESRKKDATGQISLFLLKLFKAARAFVHLYTDKFNGRQLGPIGANCGF